MRSALEKVFERSTNTSYASAANRASGSEAMANTVLTGDYRAVPSARGIFAQFFLNGDPVFGLIAGQTDKRRQRPRIVQQRLRIPIRGH